MGVDAQPTLCVLVAKRADVSGGSTASYTRLMETDGICDQLPGLLRGYVPQTEAH